MLLVLLLLLPACALGSLRPVTHPQPRCQIFHRLFVQKLEWIDQQTYQEIFALTQSLPGPGSTKMLYNINILRGGHLAGILAFLLWSLPGGIGACAMAVGAARIRDTLPLPVYALLSGLNSATVGLIALSAVQLSNKAITDKLSRILVFWGATAGVLYNALWYFPVLMVAGCFATIVWDYGWIQAWLKSTKEKVKLHGRKPSRSEEEGAVDAIDLGDSGATHATDNTAIPLTSTVTPQSSRMRISANTSQDGEEGINKDIEDEQSRVSSTSQSRGQPASNEQPILGPAALNTHVLSWKNGILLISAFFIFFIVIQVLRGTLESPPFGFLVFSNFLLSGCVIFGGGPVVIPLLRAYVVQPGWVSPRDFLLGLAIIQAFPGPNFSFAVYLGALAFQGAGMSPVAGAVVGYLGIFLPGIWLHTGTMGVYKSLRRYRWFTSGLRGINCSAIGLIYAAVYRLWQIGYLTVESKDGQSLSSEPWWLVTAATSYVGGMWFGLEAPVAILLGGAMGMVWYGVVHA